jgi:hypothetical protein
MAARNVLKGEPTLRFALPKFHFHDHRLRLMRCVLQSASGTSPAKAKRGSRDEYAAVLERSFALGGGRSLSSPLPRSTALA